MGSKGVFSQEKNPTAGISHSTIPSESPGEILGGFWEDSPPPEQSPASPLGLIHPLPGDAHVPRAPARIQLPLLDTPRAQSAPGSLPSIFWSISEGLTPHSAPISTLLHLLRFSLQAAVPGHGEGLELKAETAKDCSRTGDAQIQEGKREIIYQLVIIASSP